ncbi:RDD family protein [Draconibacterium orientale]|uniref:RDD family protein n=1 Tax=Draconibacterium orientale TaxID=1168034 RepID=UPI0038B2D27A
MNGKTLRLVNFLIDSAIYFLIMFGILILFKDVIPQQNVKWISIIVYFLYYFILESTTGQTIGKIITRSKVVSSTESKNYFFLRIILRTMTRFIPIDILTYLFSFRGLHDWISKTTVNKL